MAYQLASNTFIDDTQNVDMYTIQARNGLFKVTDFHLAQNFGYTSGGRNAASTPTVYNTTDRFPFSVATANASDVGDLTVARTGVAGQSSSTHGYTSGGGTGAAASNVIDRFPFASATVNSTDVGDLTVARIETTGQSSDSQGYSSGGSAFPAPSPTSYNTIDRFPFASATVNATDVGDMTLARFDTAGQSSADFGYNSGGTIFTSSTRYNIIERFPFSATTTNATDVGDLTQSRGETAGQSSASHGYTSGGILSPPIVYVDTTDRFPFSSLTTNAADTGNLSVVRKAVAGQSSKTHGYTSGGAISTPASSNVIDRFPFAESVVNSTDVGDLTVAREFAAGQQY
jgi:hypothetical protein